MSKGSLEQYCYMRDSQGFYDIKDYGFLSDCRSAALVGKDGSIDWMCWPSFDSRAIFSRLIDTGGGFWEVEVEGFLSSKQHYIIDTNVLVTLIETKTGVLEITDWLHIGNRQALNRRFRCVRGEVKGLTRLNPRANYGRTALNFKPVDDYLVASIESSNIVYNSRIYVSGFSVLSKNYLTKRKKLVERFVYTASDKKHDPKAEANFSIGLNKAGPSNLFVSLRTTKAYWRNWLESLKLPEEVGIDVVKRAALTIKGLQYSPSGAFVAAPTTSLPASEERPELIDRRLSWASDAAFISYSLLSVGGAAEVEGYFDWLSDQAFRHQDTEIQLLRPSDGELSRKEISASGWRGHSPVIVGASNEMKFELSTLGELVDAISIHHRRENDLPTTTQRWNLVRKLANTAVSRWREEDYGFWLRTGETVRKNYTYSKVQCWVALDRAIRMSAKAPEESVSPQELDIWRECKADIHSDVLALGWDADKNTFVQSYGSDVLDATNLLLARIGFVRPDDPRFIGTVRYSQKNLLNTFGMVKKYSGVSNETLPICSLWMVLALIEIKEYGEAEILYQRIIGQANDLGLFSEALSERGNLLGNFPDSSTAAALIVASFALDRHRDPQFDRRKFL